MKTVWVFTNEEILHRSQSFNRILLMLYAEGRTVIILKVAHFSPVRILYQIPDDIYGELKRSQELPPEVITGGIPEEIPNDMAILEGIPKVIPVGYRRNN